MWHVRWFQVLQPKNDIRLWVVSSSADRVARPNRSSPRHTLYDAGGLPCCG